MKKPFLQLILIFTFLFSTLIYGQAESPGNEAEATGGESTGGESTGADTIEEGDSPIDGKLLWLAFAGIAFAVYHYNTKSKKNIA